MAGSITASGTTSSSATGYVVSELLTKISDKLLWLKTDAASYNKIYQAITACGMAACTWEGQIWPWLHGRGLFQPLTKTIATVANDGAVRASNVVTMVTTAVHGLSSGRYVRVANCDDSTIDGTHKITVTNTTTFTFQSFGDDSESGNGSLYSNEYPLRTVNSSDMSDLFAVTRVYFDDDRRMVQATYDEIRHEDAVGLALTENEPVKWCVTTDSRGPVLHLSPTPDAADTTDAIHIDYIKFHNKIAASQDSYLIVPPEYQEGIYVDGPLWLLRRDVGDIESLKQCPGFMEAIGRMYQSRSAVYGDDPLDKFDEVDGGGILPNNRRSIGGVLWNKGSVS